MTTQLTRWSLPDSQGKTTQRGRHGTEKTYWEEGHRTYFVDEGNNWGGDTTRTLLRGDNWGGDTTQH